MWKPSLLNSSKTPKILKPLQCQKVVKKMLGCSTGVKQCVAGGIKCMPTHVKTVEICNKIDDDCDGQTDEDCISEEEAREIGVLK